MTINAVFFDLGGVILRTEYQAPREHLAERLGVSYEDLVRMVFETESARRASLGEISTKEHWDFIANRLGRPASEASALRDEFFGGDVLDRVLLEYIRFLRPARRTGLISNGWLDSRDYLIQNKVEDAFDAVVISAEVGLLKPDPRIYELALGRLDVPAPEAVLVDDALLNVEAAAALGMTAIHFGNPDQAMHDLAAVLA